MKTGRNDPCPCGSGRKYKRCCLDKSKRMSRTQKLLALLIGAILLAGAIGIVLSVTGPREGSNRVWSEEHGHWHAAP
ncbi:hypothetical protein BH24PSE2_BH24PSE2_08750 [soil metagenome]